MEGRYVGRGVEKEECVGNRDGEGDYGKGGGNERWRIEEGVMT